MKVKAKSPWCWQVPRRQEVATDSTEYTGLTGRALHTALQTGETEIYIRVLPTHAQILLIRSHLHIVHQNAHICIHQPPPHTQVCPIHICERLCHHFSPLVTLTMRCVLGYCPSPRVPRSLWLWMVVELKRAQIASKANSYLGITELWRARIFWF